MVIKGMSDIDHKYAYETELVIEDIQASRDVPPEPLIKSSDIEIINNQNGNLLESLQY